MKERTKLLLHRMAPWLFLGIYLIIAGAMAQDVAHQMGEISETPYDMLLFGSILCWCGLIVILVQYRFEKMKIRIEELERRLDDGKEE